MLIFWRTVPAPPPQAIVSETFRLTCLSPEQAVKVFSPHIQTKQRMSIWTRSPGDVIHVKATREDIAMMRSQLDRYDSPAHSQCARR